MFYDCGSKVKIVARVVMVLSAVCAFISFLIPFLETHLMEFWWAGLLGAIGAVIFGYITSLVLYTIGDTWEKALNAEYYLLRPLKSSEKSKQDAQAEQPTASAPQDDGWRCSCGHINNKVKTTCSRCGKAKES